ncbi:type II toxin-antitoxin system VapB family antitoxin [Kribbella sp. NBC_01245]|uniref:type II toxin-antitoxin system VapB family antitoxin n=1 Tax=Kribbella sp. NBC_01245 TaxID=2903578 RepID=UPI002E2921D5|nr:type II toxin-antitoxin system VapB family antitoxin [Kribbella sp. NBC_01245]
MTKTLIDIDDNLLAQATSALGTRTKKDTVNEALARVVRIAAFESAVEFAREGGFDDALNPEVMKGAWR